MPSPVSYLYSFGLLQSNNWSLSECPPLTSKIAIVTGGQGGIGAEIVKQLLLNDVLKVIVIARSREKFDRLVREAWSPALNEAGLFAREGRIVFLECDLCDLRAVDAVGRELVKSLERLDILFLNAAIPMISEYVLSPQGVETIFAANHLGHFHLTNILLPLLIKTPKRFPSTCTSSRIVATTSSMYIMASQISYPSLTSPKPTTSLGGLHNSTSRYARSKLANILFVKELSRRLETENVFVNTFNPGNVPTEAMEVWKQHLGPLGGIMRFSFKYVGQSVEEAAATGLFLAVAKEVESEEYRGEIWGPVARKETSGNKIVDDPAEGRKLWQWSEEIVRDTFIKDESHLFITHRG
ncbi:hypothetical protein RUND412_000447 [Rhizina undulata]